MAYINFKDALRSIEDINIKKGDIVLVSSNIIRLLKTIKDNEEILDPNLLINVFQDIVGSEGTLLFPTYNWDFCRGLPFDYHKTPSMTGSLSRTALKRKDFKRTKHPIYSFAVWGKYHDFLYSLENTDSFGRDSPFNFLYAHHGKNLMIDIDYQDSFTFLHYVEESIGVTYRYLKQFQAAYISENSESKEREFSMYVRNLELDTENNINPIGEVFAEKGIARKNIINNIPFVTVELNPAFEVIKDDIVNNHSGNLVTYKGQ